MSFVARRRVLDMPWLAELGILLPHLAGNDRVRRVTDADLRCGGDRRIGAQELSGTGGTVSVHIGLRVLGVRSWVIAQHRHSSLSQAAEEVTWIAVVGAWALPMRPGRKLGSRRWECSAGWAGRCVRPAGVRVWCTRGRQRDRVGCFRRP